MGEYVGSDKLYYQWFFIVWKGSGVILNIVKIKVNLVMKIVYKFVKDYVKMGIKEVKNCLK